jgi:hypothetical protein
LFVDLPDGYPLKQAPRLERNRFLLVLFSLTKFSSFKISAAWMDKEDKQLIIEKLGQIYSGFECLLDCVNCVKEEAFPEMDEDDCVSFDIAPILAPDSNSNAAAASNLEIIHSESFTIKKSRFMAHCARVTSIGMFWKLFFFVIQFNLFSRRTSERVSQNRLAR